MSDHASAANGDGPGMPNRRGEPRRLGGPQTYGFLSTPADESRSPAEVHNLSQGGVSLRVAGRPLAPGQIVILELGNKIRNFKTEIVGRVVHALTESAGNYTLGCAFARRLTDTEVLGLL